MAVAPPVVIASVVGLASVAAVAVVIRVDDGGPKFEMLNS